MIGKHAWQAQILDVIRHVLLLQHPSDLEEVTSRESANLSTIKTGRYGSENMTSRVALWDWAAILQAYTKRCQRVQVNANSSSITTKDQYQSMKFCNLAFNRQCSYQSVSH